MSVSPNKQFVSCLLPITNSVQTGIDVTFGETHELLVTVEERRPLVMDGWVCYRMALDGRSPRGMLCAEPQAYVCLVGRTEEGERDLNNYAARL